MKYLILSLFSLSILSSCNKLDELTKFNLDFEQEVTIPAATVVDIPVEIETIPIETNFEEEYKNNNTAIDLIESVKLNQVKLTIKSPESANFNFLKSVEVFIESDGKPSTRILYIDDVPEGVTVLEAEVDDVDLKQYLESETINFKLKTETDQIISQDYILNCFVQLRVDAKILGV